MSVLLLLWILFIVLKLTAVVTWTWLQVCIPLILQIVLQFIIMVWGRKL